MGCEVRQVKLYSRLAWAQKRQKNKFVPRLLSMIVVPVQYREFKYGEFFSRTRRCLSLDTKKFIRYEVLGLSVRRNRKVSQH